MFSLLPSEEKKKIRREYFLRLGIVFLCFSFFSILLASFLIIPLYMLTHGMRKALTQEAAILENSPNLKEAEVIKKTLRESKDKIAVLSSESEQREVGGLVAASLQKRKGLAITITTFNYSREGNALGIITLEGQSSNRDDLLAFKKRFEQDPLWTSVELPVSNFARDKEISFSLKLSGSF
ncbi:MAG: hypothetical protein A3A22_00390 [Candidatus Taylorbacteria bacterium RIFCSPLOWO2_01_FULL_45_34b]|nr:MAG: hypothetical protein A3A22_00390 [Candidatus Taylorbacteria bacterium RIFCSPLOWO2_01_FULL_45_34b]